MITNRELLMNNKKKAFSTKITQRTKDRGLWLLHLMMLFTELTHKLLVKLNVQLQK
jgi:hypothetical protein